MIEFLKKAINYLLFKKKERDLIIDIARHNKKYGWNKKIEKKTSVFVDGINNYMDIMTITRLLNAEGIAETEKMSIYILNYKGNTVWKQLYESYNGKLLSLCSDMIRRPISCLIEVIKAIIFLICKNGDDLVNYKVNGVPVGELIYEGILRTEHILTIKKFSFMRDFKYILLGFLVTEHASRMCRKFSPAYYVAYNNSYIDAIYLKEAVHYGAKGIRCVGFGEDLEMIDEFGKNNTYADEFIRREVIKNFNEIDNEKCSEYMEKYFKDRFYGSVDVESKFAYSNKIVVNREQFVRNYSLENDRKIIIVFSHCFSDACRRNTGNYKDFYDWLVETIKILSQNKKIYAFIKVHPMHTDYKETDPTNDLIKKYNMNKNLFVFPDIISTESVFGLADCIVTCFGTIGIEAPCFGIPVLLGGKPWYAGESFSNYYPIKARYEEALRNIHEVKKLDKQQIENARKIYYSYLKIHLVEKEKFYNEVIKFAKRKGDYKEIILDWLRYFRNYTIRKNLREVSYYQDGIKFAQNRITGNDRIGVQIK